ncbi:MAG: prephenate dehydratase domain-containing protein [bacterium]
MTTPLRVAFQGELGAFGELAIRQHFGSRAEAVPYAEFLDVVRALVACSVDRAVLPVHNSIAGAVTASVEVIASTEDLRVSQEIPVAVQLCVLGVPGSRLDLARELHSHPVALAQVSDFLAHHPHITAITAHDTAGAARLVAERTDMTLLAVASASCAVRYGLTILAEDVQDRADNVTRFVLLERASAPRGA